MRESPRLRRLRSDHRALQQLASESSIFSFKADGDPPDLYVVRFAGRGFWRTDAQSEIRIHESHEVHIRLGASYPRMMPELAWRSPIFHPNISASGVVCLGGYGTYWVPSLALDELCVMLWDMIRYENYDESSPYNREAAGWVKSQIHFRLPIDPRPLRDRLAGGATIPLPPAAITPPKAKPTAPAPAPRTPSPNPVSPRPAAVRPAAANAGDEVIFLDDQPNPTPPRRNVITHPATRDEGITFIE